jgi:hypothetical protein
MEEDRIIKSEHKQICIFGKMFDVEVEYFLDKSEMNDNGLYSYYYSGYHFTISQDGMELLSGQKYDDEEDMWLYYDNLEQVSNALSEIKAFLFNEYGIRRFKHSKDFKVFSYLCVSMEDEDHWDCDNMNCQVKVYYHNDVLRYEGRVNERAKLDGEVKVYTRDGLFKKIAIYHDGVEISNI